MCTKLCLSISDIIRQIFSNPDKYLEIFKSDGNDKGSIDFKINGNNANVNINLNIPYIVKLYGFDEFEHLNIDGIECIEMRKNKQKGD